MTENRLSQVVFFLMADNVMGLDGSFISIYLSLIFIVPKTIEQQIQVRDIYCDDKLKLFLLEFHLERSLCKPVDQILEIGIIHNGSSVVSVSSTGV